MKKVGRRKLKKCDQKELTRELDAVLDAIHDDILIADGQGRILKVSKSFVSVYGIEEEEILGKTVFEMERQGVFKPSVIARVLQINDKVTMRQRNNRERDLIVTALPVRDENGEIVKVVSFTRDLTDFLNLQEQYSELESRIEKYTAEIEELRSKSMELEGIVAKSAKSQDILRTIHRIAPFDANVLLTGESGVGKNMYARLIHKRSKRAEYPFIEINCGAIPENLLESELFGYEGGSFTGANKEGKIGLIELAQSGTLFLDEIVEMPLSLQVKLLNVIQNKIIKRVGGTKDIQVDFRLIAASNKDFEQQIKERKFREDLYYRLNVITIDILPLRQRREDIIPLAFFFIDKFNKYHGLDKSFSKKVFDRMLTHDWPGNIRELENIVERLLLTTEERMVEEKDLPVHMKKAEPMAEFDNQNLAEALEALEKHLVCNAYEKCGTTVGVAEALGISQPTAVRKIQKYLVNTKKKM
ncbi:MAG TPA: sigma 54-interacting transcriptional regulator [Anaerovoracaceae bacterium]|nr:sigma 54-interacting transcriptional regulator [Anaerovoracaceae bacterium]